MNLFEITFPKSRSMGHSTAVEIAQKATEYNRLDTDGLIAHQAKFDLNFYDQACHAFEIAKLTSGLSGVLIRVNGTIAPTVYGQYLWIIDILKCYVQSLKCNDTKAYCWEVVSVCIPHGAKLNSKDSFVFTKFTPKGLVQICYPCKHVLAWREEINFFHPSSIQDQIQAIVVKACVEWCPSLRLDAAMAETKIANQDLITLPSNFIQIGSE